MFRFDAGWDDDVQEDGTLAHAGAYWTEPCYPTQALCTLMAAVGIAVSAYAAHLALQLPDKANAAFGFWIIGGGLLFAGIVIAYTEGRRCRTVHFHADGTIATPHGLPLRPWRKRIKGDHANIASIEAMQLREEHCVAIISTGGDTILLSYKLNRYEALKASVMLTNALQRMRQSKARLTSRAAATRTSGEAMID